MADELTVCIATSKAPKVSMKDAFVEEVKKNAADIGVEVTAMLGREGFGCYNLGLKVRGEKAENFVNALTMALGPISRWSHCFDKFEGFVFEDLRE